MKAVFFHGAKLKYDEKNDKYYTFGGLNKEFLVKYLEYFDSVTLVTRKEKIKDSEREKISECNAENIFFNPISNFSMLKLFLGKYNKKIKEEIQKNDFCIMRMPNLISFVAIHYAIKMNKDYLIEMVGCPWDAFWNYGNIKGKLMAPFMYIMTKHYVKKAKNVIYVSNEFLQKRYPNKNNNIGCSDVNLWYIDENVLKKRLKKIESKKKDDIYKLGIIGSLNVNYKGHSQAIKALSILNNSNVQLHFLGAGNKEKWQQLAKKYKVEEQVFFDGVLPGGEKVYEWMDELDLYLIPSLQEGLPRALVEAMSRGCPAIGAKTGGIPELIGKEVIFGRKQYKKLAEMINNVIYDKTKLKEMANRNFQKSLEFDNEKLKLKKQKFMKNILNIH